MNDYKYDYNRTCFMRKKDESGNIEYYLKVNHQYINVNKKVFKVCKNSYNQIKYAEKIKAERSVLNYQDIDQSAFFSVQKARLRDYVGSISHNDMKQIESKLIISLGINKYTL